MTTEAVEKLAHYLGDMIATAECLESVLIREKTALRTQDVPLLQTIEQEKEQLVQALESAEKLLTRVSDGAQSDAFTWDGFVERVDPGNRHGVKQRVDQLKLVLNRCQLNNLANGAIISATRRFTEDLLALLHGREPHAPVETYSKKGQKCHSDATTRYTRA